MMVDVAIVMEKIFPNDTVLLVHDHGSWDAEALEAYNLLIDDPDWPRRKVFEGIVSKTGKECVGLQASDMIAYEIFKGVRDKVIDNEAKMRRVMEVISSKAPVTARWINQSGAEALYRIMKDSGKYPNLDTQGVC